MYLRMLTLPLFVLVAFATAMCAELWIAALNVKYSDFRIIIPVVAQGAVLDVAVDNRKSSPTFGKYVDVELSAENKLTVWIPEGFAHGFSVLTETADFLYKTTNYWFPEHERCIRWDDPALAVDWKLKSARFVSAKDAQGKTMAEAELFT